MTASNDSTYSLCFKVNQRTWTNWKTGKGQCRRREQWPDASKGRASGTEAPILPARMNRKDGLIDALNLTTSHWAFSVLVGRADQCPLNWYLVPGRERSRKRTLAGGTLGAMQHGGDHYPELGMKCPWTICGRRANVDREIFKY